MVVLGAAAAPNIAQALSVFTDDADLQLAAADALRELFAASAMGGAVRDVVHELLEEGIMGRLLEFGGVNSSVALQARSPMDESQPPCFLFLRLPFLSLAPPAADVGC